MEPAPNPLPEDPAATEASTLPVETSRWERIKERVPPKLKARLKSRKTWMIAGIVLAVYSILGFAIAPAVIRDQILKQIETRYHRTATLGRVGFNPLTFVLDVHKFSIPDADGKTLASFDRLYADIDLFSIFRGGLSFREIRFEKPYAKLVRRADGKLNVLDFAPPPSDKPKASKPLKLWIKHFKVIDGSGGVVDLARKKPFGRNFSPINFELTNFATRGKGGNYDLDAVSDEGEGIAWTGSLSLDPIASAGNFSLNKIKLRPLWEIEPDLLPAEITRGQLDLAGKYDLRTQGKNLPLLIDLSSVILSDLSLRAPDAAEDWVSAPKVTLNGVRVNTAAQSVNIAHIIADKPNVIAFMGKDKKLNLASFAPEKKAAQSTKPTASTKTAPPSKPWNISAPDIRVAGGQVAFEDRTLAAPAKFLLSPVDVSIANFTQPAQTPATLTAHVGVDGTGIVNAQGPITLNPVTADLDIDAAGLELKSAQPYLDANTGLQIISGAAVAKGKVLYADKKGVRFTGDANVDGLRTVDKSITNDFINWRSVAFDGIDVKTEPLFLHIKDITAREAYARVIIEPNFQTNIAMVLDPKGAAKAAVAMEETKAKQAADKKLKKKLKKKKQSVQNVTAPAPPQRAPLPVRIDQIRFINSSMNFSDMTVKPNFTTGVQQMNGAITGLSGNQDARADVSLKGKVDKYAPVSISGKVNYFAARSYTDLNMNFKNVELTTFSPYSGKFAGYVIKQGKMTVDLNYLVDDKKLNANHRIVINQLQLGDKVDSAEAVHLPVKLLIALLKDKNGVIDIPIPITGTLDDPKFHLGAVIWKVVLNLFVKIVTSPFALLGGIGGHGDDLQFIDFAPGSAILDTVQLEKVAALKKALDERPGLNLEVPLTYSAIADRNGVVDEQIRKEIADRMGRRAEKPGAIEALIADRKDYKNALEAVYRKHFKKGPDIPKPAPGPDGAEPDKTEHAIAWLLDQLHANIPVSEEALKALAKARADAVQAALLDGSGIDPGRVFIIAKPPLDSTAGPVKMQLSLS